MKKTIIAGLVLLAAIVSAKNTVIYEDFDRYTAPNEWRDYWNCTSSWDVVGRENKFLQFHYTLFGDERAHYYKILELKVGDRYSIQYDYYGDDVSILVCLGRTTIGTLYSVKTWTWVKFKAEGTIKKTETGQFWILIFTQDKDVFNIDNIIVEKCGVGIEPNSIGKIKALYE